MFIEHSTSVTSDAIHVITGVAIQLLVATLLRSSIAAWRPWLVVLVLACLNEAVDLSVERWPDLAMQYGESAKDILLTMFLPSILMIVSRFRPRLLAGAPSR